MNAPSPEGIRTRPDSLANLLVGLRRNWLLILAVASVTGLAVALFARLAPPSYIARSSLIVKLGREFQYYAETGTERSGSMFRLEEAINSVIEVLESRGLVGDVIDELGLELLYPKIAAGDRSPADAREQAIGAFQKDLGVRGIADSSVIEATFESPNRELAARALNLLIEHFDERHLAVFQKDDVEFLSVQVTRSRSALEAADSGLREFQQKSSLFNVDHQVQMLLSQRSDLEVQLQQAKLRLDELERGLPPGIVNPIQSSSVLTPVNIPERDAFQGSSGEVAEGLEHLQGDRAEQERAAVDLEGDVLVQALPSPIAFEGNRALAEAHAQLLRLEVEARQLAATYGPKSRRVQPITDEIVVLRRFLLEAAVDALEGQRRLVRSLEGSLTELERDMDLMLDRGNTLRELELQRDIATASYQSFLARMEDARISAELDRERRTSISVLDRAATPVDPVGLPFKTKILLGLIAGFGLGVLAVLFKERQLLFP